MGRGHFFVLLKIFLGSVLISSYLLFSLIYPIRKVCAVESFYVGVYWDSDCTSKVSSIDWGVLTPGSRKEMNVFLRNEELNVPCYIDVWTENWAPDEGSRYISLSYTHNFGQINVGETISTTLTLKVDVDVKGIEDFSFNIIFCGTDHMLGDLNRDEVVNVYDIVMFSYAYRSTPNDSNWNPQADLNRDDIVDIFDLAILSQSYLASH